MITDKYQGQKGSAPRLYEFEYSCYLNLKSGKKFKKVGKVMALHERQAKKIVEERFDCYNIKVNPSLNGKAFSSDVAFGTIAANSGRYRDRIN